MSQFFLPSQFLRMLFGQPLLRDIRLAPDSSHTRKSVLKIGQIKFRDRGQIRFPFFSRRAFLCLIILVVTSISIVRIDAAVTDEYVNAFNYSQHTVYLIEQVNGGTWQQVKAAIGYGGGEVSDTRTYDFTVNTVIYFLWDATISQVLPGTLQASGQGETLNFSTVVEPPCNTNVLHRVANTTGHRVDIFSRLSNINGGLWTSDTFYGIAIGGRADFSYQDLCANAPWSWADTVTVRYDLDITNATKCIQNVYVQPANVAWFDNGNNSQTDYGVLPNVWSCHTWTGTVGEYANMNITAIITALDGVFNTDTNNDFTFAQVTNNSYYGFNLASGIGTNLTGNLGFGNIHTSNSMGRVIWDANTLTGEGLATEATLRAGFIMTVDNQKNGNLVLGEILKKIGDGGGATTNSFSLKMTNMTIISSNYAITHVTNFFTLSVTNTGSMTTNEFMSVYGSASLGLNRVLTNSSDKIYLSGVSNLIVNEDIRDWMKTNQIGQEMNRNLTNLVAELKADLVFGSLTNLMGAEHIETIGVLTNSFGLLVERVDAFTNWLVQSNQISFTATNSDYSWMLGYAMDASNTYHQISRQISTNLTFEDAINQSVSNMDRQLYSQGTNWDEKWKLFTETNQSYLPPAVESPEDPIYGWFSALVGSIPAETRLGSPPPTGGMVISAGGRSYTFHVNPFEKNWVIELAAFVRGVITWSIYFSGFYMIVRVLQSTISQTAVTGKIYWNASITKLANVSLTPAIIAMKVAVLALISTAFFAILYEAKVFLVGYVVSVYINPWAASVSGNLSSGLWMADQFFPLSLMVVFPLTCLVFSLTLLKVTWIKTNLVRLLSS